MILFDRVDSFLKGLNRVPDERKASRTGPLVAMHGSGRPVWTPRDYASLAREGYARNPIVHRAVRLISEAAASVPLTLFEGERELTQHPMLELIAAPNPAISGASMLEDLYGHLLVAGNAYLELVLLDDRPRELHVLRPDRMKIVPGDNGWPTAFEYSVGGRKVRFKVEDEGRVSPVLHLKIFHPLNDHYGFSPLEAAQVSLDIHNAAAAWNKALLDNAARPSGALIYAGPDGSNLTDEQFQRLSLTTALKVGVQVRVSAGCNKSFFACRSKFSNHENFQGFPHMPGVDFVLAYPNRDTGENDGEVLSR